MLSVESLGEFFLDEGDFQKSAVSQKVVSTSKNKDKTQAKMKGLLATGVFRKDMLKDEVAGQLPSMKSNFR